MFHNIYKTPFGNIYITTTENAIISISFLQHQHVIVNSPSLFYNEIERQLNEYFKGTLTHFSLPLQFHGTPFQQQVWNELQQIPFGETISYLQLSQRIGNEKAIRAVGTANGKNPIPIIIPCHRVIGSNGNLVGFSGGIENKRWLLRHEAKMSGKTLF